MEAYILAFTLLSAGLFTSLCLLTPKAAAAKPSSPQGDAAFAC
jgi:hypothetical protein